MGMLWLAALGHLTGFVVAAAVLLGAARAARGPRPAVPGRAPVPPVRAHRERVWRTGVPRHRDPDARGRTRPRAPAAPAG